MENESKTPAASLTGVELCERVALGMKWAKHPRRDDGMWLCNSKDADRSVVHGKHRWISPHSDSPCLESWFRPDIDGNHLAEVKAWMLERDWRWESGHWGGSRFYARVFTPSGDARLVEPGFCPCESEAVAFLRAFVAASEAEKEKIQ